MTKSFWGTALLTVLAASCSIPNLETADCKAARGALKEFYSLHFAGEMKFSRERLAEREQFLTPEFFRTLQTLQTEGDVFTTGTGDIPKAFRVGACEMRSADRARLELLLFWRDDVRSEQRKLNVETVKLGDRWLIDKISD